MADAPIDVATLASSRLGAASENLAKIADRNDGRDNADTSISEKLALEAALISGGIGQGAWQRTVEFSASPVSNASIVAATTAATWGLGYAGMRYLPRAMGAAKYLLAGAAIYEAAPGLFKTAEAALDTWTNPGHYAQNQDIVADKLGKPLFDLALYSAAGAGGFWNGRTQGKLATEIAGSLELQATRKSAATHVPMLQDVEGGAIKQLRLGKDRMMSDVYVKAAPSVVQIKHYLPDGHMSFGSGFVVEDGLIATSNHILRARVKPVIKLASGETVEATLVARDKAADLALLRLPEGKTAGLPAQLGNSNSLESNSALYMVGHPRDVSKPVVSQGILNGKYGQKYLHSQKGALDAYPNEESFAEKVIVNGNPGVRDLPHPQTAMPVARRDVMSHTAPSQPGNSGSPIFDRSGKVVGIHSTGGEFRWATSVEHLKALVGAYRAEQRPNGWLKVVTHASPKLQPVSQGIGGWLERMVTTSVDVLDVKKIGKLK